LRTTSVGRLNLRCVHHAVPERACKNMAFPRSYAEQCFYVQNGEGLFPTVHKKRIIPLVRIMAPLQAKPIGPGQCYVLESPCISEPTSENVPLPYRTGINFDIHLSADASVTGSALLS
jgi:hypothetical protein